MYYGVAEMAAGFLVMLPFLYRIAFRNGGFGSVAGVVFGLLLLCDGGMELDAHRIMTEKPPGGTGDLAPGAKSEEPHK